MPIRSLHLLPFAVFFLLFPDFGHAQVQASDVTIYRDEWGVPHIHGKTDAAVAYGLAWAHAEDNFHDIQLNMLMSRGRQGEVTGKEGAIIDFAVKHFRVPEIVAERYQEDVSEGFKRYLQGYSDGMNAYARNHPESVLLRGVFPVNPQDILTGYVMSLVLMEGVHFHIKNIMDGFPEAPTPYSLRGSNGFAFNSSITESGETFLVNNSHQPLDGPVAWYEAHLISDEGMNVLGGLFPGGTTVFAGTNEQIAWMHTVNLPDLVDVYELKMHPKEKLQYQLDGEWMALEVRNIPLKVKMGPVMLKLKKKSYWSKHGPVMEHKGRFFALRFPALFTIKAAEQWYMMGKSQSFSQFKQALKIGGLPSLNIIYADRRDTIFYIDNGLYPMRDPAYDWLGVLPGDKSELIWNNFHPLEDIPQLLNPRSGYVFNTNNSPWNSTDPAYQIKKEDYDPTLYNFPVENNRSLRVNELMRGKRSISWEEMLQLKYDQQYPDSLYIHFLANINDIFHYKAQDFPQIKDELEVFEKWNHQAEADNEQAALFIKTFDFLYEKAIKDHKFAVQTDYPAAHYVQAIQSAGKYMRKHFGSLEVPLGEFQRHVRGYNDYPIGGGPDVIAAMTSEDWKRGRKRSYLGDSYIQLIRFSEEGVKIQSVQPYGNSNVKGTPHFDDQVEMYLNHKTKEESLDLDWAKKHAERSYSPGN